MITPEQQQALEKLVSGERSRTYARLLDDGTVQVVVGDSFHTDEHSVAPGGEIVLLESHTLGRARELFAEAATIGGLLMLLALPGLVLFGLDHEFTWNMRALLEGLPVPIGALELIASAFLIAACAGAGVALAFQWLDPLLTPDPSGGTSHRFAFSEERWDVGAWVRIEENAFSPFVIGE